MSIPLLSERSKEKLNTFFKKKLVDVDPWWKGYKDFYFFVMGDYLFVCIYVYIFFFLYL